MSEHIQEWLGAYLDGELRGWRLQQVEKHLAECQECSTELAELRNLSALLQEAPIERDFTPAERFAAQVLLRLPPQQEPSLRSRVQKASWWLVPATLLGAATFAQTAGVVSWFVWAAGQTGLLGAAAAQLQDVPQYNLWFHTALNLFNGSLAGAQPALNLAESWGQAFLGQATWLVILAGLYWTWLALWWFRHQRLSSQREIAFSHPDQG